MSLLPCQQDARLLALPAQVLSCAPTGADRYAVTLDQTPFYPEGGGQPADHGWLGPVRVLDVQRGAEGVVHTTDGPVCGEVQAQVDPARRLDHMVQHTGQHLLTAVVLRDLGAPTTSFHLGPQSCDIELDIPALSPDQLDAIEAACNALIREARPVGVHGYAADALPAEVRSRGLPEGLSGPVRLIEIAGLDLNTCGGTHVSNTAELQALKLLSTERIRGGTRLYFAVGGRVLRGWGQALAREAALSRLLSVPAERQVDAVARTLDEAKATGKALKAAQAELATALGEALAATAGDTVSHHREDGDLGFLGGIAAVIQARRPEVLALLTAGQIDGVFLLVGPPERVAALGPQVAATLEGRGGGAKGRFQGKASRLDRRGELGLG